MGGSTPRRKRTGVREMRAHVVEQSKLRANGRWSFWCRSFVANRVFVGNPHPQTVCPGRQFGVTISVRRCDNLTVLHGRGVRLNRRGLPGPTSCCPLAASDFSGRRFKSHRSRTERDESTPKDQERAPARKNQKHTPALQHQEHEPAPKNQQTKNQGRVPALQNREALVSCAFVNGGALYPRCEPVLRRHTSGRSRAMSHDRPSATDRSLGQRCGVSTRSLSSLRPASAVRGST